MNGERLTHRDWILIAVCAAIAAVSLFVIFNWFNAAFPEASIEFRYDRNGSVPLAEAVLARQGIDARGMKHSAIFDGDDTAKIFLERSLGLARANNTLRRDVRRVLPEHPRPDRHERGPPEPVHGPPLDDHVAVYVEADCHEDGSVKTFRADRITAARLDPEKALPSGGRF